MEALKLDRIDLEVGWWISTHRPRALEAWIEFTQKDYVRRGVSINAPKLLSEFQDIELLEKENL